MIRRFLQRLRRAAAGIAILGLVAMPPVGTLAMHHGQPCATAPESGHARHDAPPGDHQGVPNGTDCCLNCLGCATVAFHAGDPVAVPVVIVAAPLPVDHRSTDEFRRPPVPHALPFSLPPPASIA